MVTNSKPLGLHTVGWLLGFKWRAENNLRQTVLDEDVKTFSPVKREVVEIGPPYFELYLGYKRNAISCVDNHQTSTCDCTSATKAPPREVMHLLKLILLYTLERKETTNVKRDHEEMNCCPLCISSASVLLCDVSHVWSENMSFQFVKE
jgi:hypothetical protein